ncbi:membrane protein [Oleiphilus messinensis]|uniref:Membrane protein n=1 Tax=Oleiphilus messinensis TaxID=141451 RepID=A0A1Y0I6E0_9GAMM|nr:hypothetical protein [Oleiphilus messinensis]ARU55356.1 membrane protein [Oleiphilus messinensis]
MLKTRFTITQVISRLMLASYLIAPGLSHAVDVTWSGFASFAAGQTLGSDDTEYMVDNITGGAYEDTLRFLPESIMAIQTSAQVNETISATVQVAGKGSNETSFDTSFEWAYATLAVTDETWLNFGRFRVPLFYYSDFLDTSYAYYWLRAPIDMYVAPFSTTTGISLNDFRYLGDVELSTQVWIGEEQFELLGFPGEITDSVGINLMIAYDWIKLRGVYSSMDTVIEGLGADTNLIYTAFAIIADYESFKFRSEYGNLEDTNTGIEDKFGYASVGYAIGSFTPHYTYSEQDRAAFFLAEAETHTIGVRWDYLPGTAFKLEYSKSTTETTPCDPMSGMCFPPQETEIEVIAAAIDFTF